MLLLDLDRSSVPFEFVGQSNKSAIDRLTCPALRLLSGPGLGLYGLAITFASIDWFMSLEPRWFSSIYGVVIAVGMLLSAFAFAVLVTTQLAKHSPESDMRRRESSMTWAT